VKLLALAATVAVAGFAAPAAPAAAPALRILDDNPLTLRGTGFRPAEAVRVTVRMGPKRWTQAARAGTHGGFTVRFRIRLDYCATPLTISARGALGSRAVARIPIRECAAP
jgi:hypothetical protein